MSQKTGFLSDNLNQVLKTFLHDDNRRHSNLIYTALDVKSHGTIAFPDNKSNRAQFIRIAPNSPVIQVKKLLETVWCSERPSLVISITGGAKDLNMKPKLLNAFRKGLYKVVRTTGAWIITGGMKTGVMKLVGDIIQFNNDRSRPTHLIGIATWGCVAGKEQLDVHGATVQYERPQERKGEAAIEPNHTNFIFVDDGSVRAYGVEIQFRAELEQAISGGFFGPHPQGHCDVLEEESDAIPVVLLVIEGGPNTVRTVHEAVVKNNIPAVLFEGTGRCCDLFAKGSNLYNQYLKQFNLDDENLDLNSEDVLQRYDKLKSKLRQNLADEINNIRGKGDQTDYFALVYECLHERKNFMNIVSLNSRSSIDPDIDLAILQALLNATLGIDPSKPMNQQRREKLHLALQWNRSDIAKNYIMKDVTQWNNIDLEDLFLLALNRGQLEFVKLFLDNDFSVSNAFRNRQALPLLYLRAMKQYANINSVPDDALKMIYEDIIQPLVGDYFDINAVLNSDEYMFDNSNERERDISCCGVNQSSNGDIEIGYVTHSNHQIDVDKELFVWSVLTGQRDFNILFWARAKNKICGALFATLIYRKRARKDNDNSYYQSADEFERLAVEILNDFYAISPSVCSKAIIRKIPAYGNVTWLDLAISAEAKEFIAQRAVQEVLDNIWFGYIDHREGDRVIMFCTLFLWYSGFLRYHDELVKHLEQGTFLNDLFNKSKLVQNHLPKKSTHQALKFEQNANMRLLGNQTLVDSKPVEFIQVGCFEKTKHRVAKYFNNISKFIRAPYVKFLYSVYSHVTFLTLFSYFLLCNFYPLYEFETDICPPKQSYEIGTDDDESKTNETSDYHGLIKHNRPTLIENILIIWVFTLFIEEIRQFLSSDAATFRNMIASYFAVFWNVLDCLALVLFVVAIGLRWMPSVECFCAARIVLAVDLSLWFLRLLDIFAAVKRLGPKLIMIGEMANALKVYAVMLIIFVMGYGISFYSLLYGTREFSWHIIRRVLNLSFWQIFGDLKVLEMFENNYGPDGYAAFVLLLIYMALSAIILVNLLIAMFSNTFDRLENDTDRIWKFQRYSLICEYLTRPSLPAPLIIFSHLWRLILLILTRCINSSWLKTQYYEHTSRTKYKIGLDEKSAMNIELVEEALADDAYFNFITTGRKLVHSSSTTEDRTESPQEAILHRVESLEGQIQMVANSQTHMFDYLNSIMDALRLVGGDQIKMPERYDVDEDDLPEDPNSLLGQAMARRASIIKGVSCQSSFQSDDAPPNPPTSPIVNLFPQT